MFFILSLLHMPTPQYLAHTQAQYTPSHLRIVLWAALLSINLFVWGWEEERRTLVKNIMLQCLYIQLIIGYHNVELKLFNLLHLTTCTGLLPNVMRIVTMTHCFVSGVKKTCPQTILALHLKGIRNVTENQMVYWTKPWFYLLDIFQS